MAILFKEMYFYSFTIVSVQSYLWSVFFCSRMLEDFGNEMDSADAKMDATMKKVAKIMHMTNGVYCSHA